MGRYAAAYLPNTPTWDFWEALSSAEVTKAAFAREKISTEGENVDKFLKLTLKRNIAKQKGIVIKIFS